MNTKTIGSMPADELLGLQIDLATKLRKKVISISQFKLFLQGRNPFSFPNSIKLGTFKAVGHLQAAIDKVGGEISDYAVGIMAQPLFLLAESKISVDLVIVSGEDLGFTGGATRQEIYARATSEEYGYMLCPPEVGPQLRLQYPNQPRYERLQIAMEPIPDSGGTPRIFVVESYNDCSCWLLADYIGDPVDEEERWVFVRTRVVRFTEEEAKKKVGKRVLILTELNGVAMGAAGRVTDVYRFTDGFDVVIEWENPRSIRTKDRFTKTSYERLLREDE